MRDNSLVARNRIPRPVIKGEYKNIYAPKGCVYEGIPGVFEKGHYYERWIANDHGFIKGKDGWHIYGITHPLPEDYIDDYNDGEHVHANEEMMFHAVAKGSFKENFRDDAYEDCEKILYPDQRPGEAPAIHAPHMFLWEDQYHMIYGPVQIRYAVSENLYDFRQGGVLFEGLETSRDPNVFVDDDGTIYILYAFENKVCYRTSSDMKVWSEEKVLQVNPYEKGTCESPFMMKREGYYYLFWCIWDESCGSYDNRTFVFGSKSLDGFMAGSPLTILTAHAPEVIVDEDGDYFISSAYYPYNGVSVARIEWE